MAKQISMVRILRDPDGDVEDVTVGDSLVKILDVEPGVTEELSQVILVCSRDTYGENGEIVSDTTKRKKVLKALIPILQTEKETDLYWLVYGRFPLLTSTDLVWLVEWLLSEPLPERRLCWGVEHQCSKTSETESLSN